MQTPRAGDTANKLCFDTWSLESCVRQVEDRSIGDGGVWNVQTGAETRNIRIADAPTVAVRVESLGAQSLFARQSHVIYLARECWRAARSQRLHDYLGLIPVTRLNMAQSAFRDIGAVRAANILRSGVYRLTRSAGSDLLADVVQDLTTQLSGLTEDMEQRLERYGEPRGRRARRCQE